MKEPIKILVINSGSSSIKYQLIKMPDEEVVCSGLVERIGFEDAEIHYKSKFNKIDEVVEIRNHRVGLEKIANLLLDKKTGVIKSTSEVEAVGHRVVHGGSTFSETTVINDKVKSKIKELFSLAPLHNPPNYEGIIVAETFFPTAKQIAVFDTAFHQSIPIEAYKYSIPNKFLGENNIRKYGFHGTSHKYVSKKAIAYLGAENSNIITIHLGNGASIAAIDKGVSIDTSMGFTPLEGLLMGTRSGDLDPSIITYVMGKEGLDIRDMNALLNKHSGLIGVSGESSDMRELEEAVEEGDRRAKNAFDLFNYRIKKYIG